MPFGSADDATLRVFYEGQQVVPDIGGSDLRRDPFEKAQHNSNTYNDWFLDRPFVIVPMTQMAGKFLLTMKDYPPSATAGSFNLSKLQKQIEKLSEGNRD